MTQILILLIAGHVAAEFLPFDTKARGHLVVVVLAHVGALVALQPLDPVWNGAWFAAFPSLVAAHGLVDAVVGPWERRRGQSLATFTLRQGLHVATIVATARVVLAWGSPVTPPPGVLRTAVLVTAYIACAFAGSEVVRLVLTRYRLADGGAGDRENRARMGHAIGVLERWLGLTFILVGAWMGLGGIIAAKSIARFKDLDRRDFGEYYLIGTLTSLWITVLTGVASLRLLDRLP